MAYSMGVSLLGVTSFFHIFFIEYVIRVKLFFDSFRVGRYRFFLPVIEDDDEIPKRLRVLGWFRKESAPRAVSDRLGAAAATRQMFCIVLELWVSAKERAFGRRAAFTNKSRNEDVLYESCCYIIVIARRFGAFDWSSRLWVPIRSAAPARVLGRGCSTHPLIIFTLLEFGLKLIVVSICIIFIAGQIRGSHRRGTSVSHF